MIVDASAWTSRPREVGLIFSGPMVRAIFEDRKTVTRRLRFGGQPGDVLWIRETWAEQNGLILFRADWVDDAQDRMVAGGPVERWRSPIHLRRADARLFLLVEKVGLGDWMNDEDAAREGFISAGAFCSYWNWLNEQRGAPWPPKEPPVRVAFRRIVNYPWAGCGPQEK